MDPLTAAIDAPPPTKFDALAAADREELARLVEGAARERSRLIDRSIDESLRHLPGLLRGPVKRVLGV